mmetsp:Transcript_14718/g.31365  ORF Transcript_14718/g.31365 Transcript_14718/m.31365 type:complete len:117 (-) Transcript_14718:1365-1715(-)
MFGRVQLVCTKERMGEQVKSLEGKFAKFNPIVSLSLGLSILLYISLSLLAVQLIVIEFSSSRCFGRSMLHSSSSNTVLKYCALINQNLCSLSPDGPQLEKSSCSAVCAERMGALVC